MNKILDIKIIRNCQNRVFHMNQEHYFIDVLAQFNMTIDKHMFIKLFINEYNAFCFVELNNKRINQKNYQHAIENIMYATIHIRLDIAYAIEKFNQYFSDFVKHYKQALKHLLRYIKSTVNKEITYENNESHKLVEYSDSNYAVERLNWKFILAYVYMIVEDSISWMNWKQKFVIIFITEVKYIAISTCVKEDMWLVQLLKDLKYSKYLESDEDKLEIFEDENHRSIALQLRRDNQAANYLVRDAHIHEQFKHIDVAYHHVRDLVKRNLIQLNYTLSVNMMIDGLTKSLTRDRFKSFVWQLDFSEI